MLHGEFCHCVGSCDDFFYYLFRSDGESDEESEKEVEEESEKEVEEESEKEVEEESEKEESEDDYETRTAQASMCTKCAYVDVHVHTYTHVHV